MTAYALLFPLHYAQAHACCQKQLFKLFTSYEWVLSGVVGYTWNVVGCWEVASGKPL